MNRLSRATLGQRASGVAAPSYALGGRTPGIVHFGPGAFHRAHQAAAIDAILPADPRWSIAGVALNSTSTARALTPQDGLYTLALLSEQEEYRIIGAIAELLTAADHDRILARMAASTTLMVTATVTEKGYCLAPDGGLDHGHPAIVHDLATPARPQSFIGWLVQGLAARRRAGAPGIAVLSCDNLAANGSRLRRATLDYAQAVDRDLAGWIDGEIRFPAAMVDSITPATDDALRQRVAAAIGLEDAWPIQREPFTQWVIEDDFPGERPPLEAAGVQFVRSVTPFEEAKLRLLNGAHSTLAYAGILRGHRTVAGAMADAGLAAFVEAMMREDIAPTLAPLEGQPIPDYITAILDRFRNPGIRHLLSQIAWDGSQKLPFRILATIADRRREGLAAGRLALPIAAWFRFLALPRAADDPIVDPLADRIAPLARAGDIDSLLDIEAIFPPPLAADAGFRVEIHDAFRVLTKDACLAEWRCT